MATAAELLARVQEQFPEITCQSCRLVTEGWDHEVLILDERLVFRFPNDPEWLAALRDEVTVLDRLQPLLPLQIPQYRYVAPDGSFAGYSLVPGAPLLRETFFGLPADERSAIAAQLAAFMSALHAVGDTSLVPLSDMREFHAAMKEKAERCLPEALSSAEMAEARSILSDMDDMLQLTLPQAFLHGDLYHRHLLWDRPDRRLGIIDFSDMNLGDPAFDFAELYEYGADFVQEVYRLYAGRKDASFLERAWAYERWVGIHMMVDHFSSHKTTFAVARETFDFIREKLPPDMP